MENGMPVTKQDQEFLACVVRCIWLDAISKENKQRFIENPTELSRALLSAFVSKTGNVPELQDEIGIRFWWTNFYQKYFNLKVDLSAVKIPDHQADFDWVIIIAAGLTISQVLKALKKQIRVWLYKDDLSDKDIPVNDRNAKSSYAVRFRKRVEADEKLKNKSANDLKDDGFSYITLLERLVMELAYYEETGKHLDINNVTLCAGSRYSDGSVPSLYWHSCSDLLGVNYYNPDYFNDSIRARVVVSC